MLCNCNFFFIFFLFKNLLAVSFNFQLPRKCISMTKQNKVYSHIPHHPQKPFHMLQNSFNQTQPRQLMTWYSNLHKHPPHSRQNTINPSFIPSLTQSLLLSLLLPLFLQKTSQPLWSISPFSNSQCWIPLNLHIPQSSSLLTHLFVLSLKWGHFVVDLGYGFWSLWLFFWDFVRLARLLLRIEDPKTCKSRFGPSGLVLLCFWKLGMYTLPFFVVLVLLFLVVEFCFCFHFLLFFSKIMKWVLTNVSPITKTK